MISVYLCLHVYFELVHMINFWLSSEIYLQNKNSQDNLIKLYAYEIATF